MAKNTKKNAFSSSIKAREKYNKKAYDEIKLRVKAGNKDIIKTYAAEHGTSVNALLNELLKEKGIID